MKKCDENEINKEAEGVEDFHIELNDLESELKGELNILKKEISRLREDLYTWNKLFTLSIPYTYEKFLLSINQFLPRTWFPLILEKYRNLEDPRRDIPDVILQKKLDSRKWCEDLIFENLTYLRNARVFCELGSSVSVDIKPILLYYSSTYLFSFFVNSLIIYKNKREHHGIKIKVEGKDVNKIRIKLLSEGFFPRLVRTLSFLHYTSVFSDFIIDFEGKHGEIKEPVLCQNKNEFTICNKNGFLLQDLLNMNPDVYYYKLNELNLKYYVVDMYSKFKNISELLRNYILLFVACSLARYNPLVWKEIYEGEKTDFFIRIQPSFDDINSITDLILDKFGELKNNRYPRFQGNIGYFSG